jgi:iron complex outermembrane receptor protein
VFAEFQLPFHDTLKVTLAAHSEDCRGNLAVSTNPKIAFKWEPASWVAFRSSAGSTFRATIASFTDPGFDRNSQQFTNPLSGGPLFQTVDTFGTPDLKPETADSYNFGILFDFDEPPLLGGGLRTSLDYFNFAVKDEITVEDAGSLYTTLFPSANKATWRCGDTQLVARFTFVDGVCNPNYFLALRVNRINTAGVDLSSLDFSITWDTPPVPYFAGADFTIGIDGTLPVRIFKGCTGDQRGDSNRGAFGSSRQI